MLGIDVDGDVDVDAGRSGTIVVVVDLGQRV
jgi:hypothetical protein